MTNDELKKKIAKFICNACEMGSGFDGECDIGNDYQKCSICGETADALIEAGIGDVKEAEHRAKTLERAFRDFLAEYLTAVNEANSYDCGIPEMFGRYANVLPYEDKVTNLLNEYLQQAEKELAEEGKE